MSEANGKRVPVSVPLEWKPAVGKELIDYGWGTLCKDANGDIWLIGDAIQGSNYDGGCGCCSDHITNSEIVEYANVIDLIDG